MNLANLPSRARWFCESGCGLGNIGNGAGCDEPSRCGGFFYEFLLIIAWKLLLQLDYDAARAKDELADVLANIKPMEVA